MVKVDYQSESGSALIFFALIGAIVASAFFAMVFITSSKAHTPDPRANLKIPIPSVPTIPSATPHLRATPVPTSTPRPTPLPSPSP
jgi:hypothetical protein